MCIGCCIKNSCGSTPYPDLPVNFSIIALIENETENEDIQANRENLEHLCVHDGEVETLKYLLKVER